MRDGSARMTRAAVLHKRDYGIHSELHVFGAGPFDLTRVKSLVIRDYVKIGYAACGHIVDRAGGAIGVPQSRNSGVI